MKKLLRILFVMCAFTFITTVTACRTTELLGITEPNPEPSAGDDKTETIAGGGNTETSAGTVNTEPSAGTVNTEPSAGDTTPTDTEPSDGTVNTKPSAGNTETSAGSDNTKTIAGNDNTETAKQPDQLQVDPIEFLIEPPTDNTGITVDETEDVVKVTIKPSLLTYVAGYIADTHRAPIFTVTFKNNEKGFIIPTRRKPNDIYINQTLMRSSATADKIIGETTWNSTNGQTYGYLTARNTPAFTLLSRNLGWLHAGNQVNFIVDRRAFLMCETTLTGINERSFASDAPAVADDLAFGDDTKTECFLNLETTGATATDVLKKEARKDWAAKVIELHIADPEAAKNLHSVSFLGIATGDAKASDISKLAPTFVEIAIDNNTHTFPAEIKKLTDTYANNVLRVEIVIEAATN